MVSDSAQYAEVKLWFTLNENNISVEFEMKYHSLKNTI